MKTRTALRRLVLKAMLRLPGPLQIRLSGKAPIHLDGATLEPSLQLMFANAGNFSHQQQLDLHALRQLLTAESELYALHRECMASVREFRVDKTMVRVFQPRHHDGSALFYLHGGGWILGGLDSSDRLSRYLAKKTGSIVFSIDYRLAPEAPFPAACNDSLSAYRWLLDNLEKFAVNPNKVFIAGDSAGGNLSSALSQDCYYLHLPQPAGQILISPLLDPNSDRPSRHLFAKGFGLNSEAIEFFLQCYLSDFEERGNPRVNTLQQLHAIDSPATLIISAGFDPLRDEARDYAKILREKQVYVEHLEYKSMVHGFFFYAGVCPKIRALLNDCCEHIKKFKALAYQQRLQQGAALSQSRQSAEI